MRSKIITSALLLIVLLYANVCFANTKLQTLWESFYGVAKNYSLEEPVRIYEVNSSYTQICFIYKKSVFIFENGQINKVQHAKMFNTMGINRITREKTLSGEAFRLWSNEKLVLEIGS